MKKIILLSFVSAIFALDLFACYTTSIIDGFFETFTFGLSAGDCPYYLPSAEAFELFVVNVLPWIIWVFLYLWFLNFIAKSISKNP